MKRNHGFTLIELLAVIIILAVIALIVTPLVLNIIERAEKGAFKDSVYGIMEAAEFQVLLDESKYPITYVFPEDGNRMKFKGTKPSEGYLQIVTEGKIKLALGNGRWCATKEANDSQVIVKNGKCEKIDLNRPILSGYGDLNQEINVNETYTMPNVTAMDKDGNPLNVITMIKQGDKAVDSIDTSKVCTYTITYTTEADTDGNTSTVTVTIKVSKQEADIDKIIESGTAGGGLEQIDNTYYFRGSNPNNYVQFNNELWRIISIENKSMKLIRNTPETKVFDSSNYADWARPATLNTYLNEEFFLVFTEEAQKQVQEGNFYIGAVNWDDNASATTMKTQERATIWPGKVGLMNISDYAYTSITDDTDPNACINKVLSNTECKNNNWLYIGKYEWTLNGSASYSDSVISIFPGGEFNAGDSSSGYNLARNSRAMRPVIYLRPDIKIIAGIGSQDSPYLIK